MIYTVPNGLSILSLIPFLDQPLNVDCNFCFCTIFIFCKSSEAAGSCVFRVCCLYLYLYKNIFVFRFLVHIILQSSITGWLLYKLSILCISHD